MKDYPLVSIITLNYNQTEVTCEFLKSLPVDGYPNLEVFVIDNASKDDPTQACLAAYPETIVIRSDENIGFSGGNNIGIQRAKGEFIFIVNNDTECTPGMIETLIRTFEEVPNLGLVCPKIYYHEKENIIQYAGFTKVNPYTGRNVAEGKYELDKGQHDQLKPTYYAHGAAMMLSREALAATGLMPTFFFIYYEELDWSEHVRKAGYEIYYQPAATIYHKESFTMGPESPMKTYYMTRNRILFMRRNFQPHQVAVFTLLFILLTTPKTLLTFLLKGKFENIGSFIRGALWNLTNASEQPNKEKEVFLYESASIAS